MEYETQYVVGDDINFVTFIKSLEDKAELIAVDGKFRWLVTRDDGTKYIARPESAKPNESDPH